MKTALLRFLWLILSASASFAQAALPLQVGDADHLSLLSWSPKDDLILTSAGEDNTLRLWEMQRGQVRWKNNVGFLQEDLELYSLRQAAWTQDQTLVATGSDNGKIQLWDVATGTLRWNIRAHADAIRGLALSPDAKLLVSAADVGDGKSELKVWQVADGKLIQHLGAKHPDVVAIRFLSPQRLQTGNGFGQIITWSTASWRAIAQQQVPLCRSGSKRARVFYHPHFTLLAAHCQKQWIVTDIRTGKVTQRIADDDQSNKPLFSQEPILRYFTDSIDSQIFDAAGQRIEDVNGGVRHGQRRLFSPHQAPVVLATAHLNHTPGDNRKRNLRALCPACHFAHDRADNSRRAHLTRATAKDLLRPLFALLAKLQGENS